MSDETVLWDPTGAMDVKHEARSSKKTRLGVEGDLELDPELFSESIFTAPENIFKPPNPGGNVEVFPELLYSL